MVRLMAAFALGAAVGMIVGVILGGMICILRDERRRGRE